MAEFAEKQNAKEDSSTHVLEEDPDEEEREHWWQVMRHFLSYIDFFETDLDRRQRHLNRLNNIYVQRLPQSTFDKLDWLFKAASNNQMFLDDMVDFQCQSSFLDPPKFAIDHHNKMRKEQSDATNASSRVLPLKDIGPKLSISQQHRNIATIHSLYREWSKEAADERNECFNPILEQLEKHLPIDKESTDKSSKYRRVLVPGCGLSRLPVEIASRGYCCEGNEFSA
jgi:carnosine N-methyltransferase